MGKDYLLWKQISICLIILGMSFRLSLALQTLLKCMSLLNGKKLFLYFLYPACVCNHSTRKVLSVGKGREVSCLVHVKAESNANSLKVGICNHTYFADYRV